MGDTSTYIEARTMQRDQEKGLKAKSVANVVPVSFFVPMHGVLSEIRRTLYRQEKVLCNIQPGPEFSLIDVGRISSTYVQLERKEKKNYVGRGNSPYINQGKEDTLAEKSFESPPPQRSYFS
eukprot:1151356-Pelagomonas_calceolata.AAC.3